VAGSAEAGSGARREDHGDDTHSESLSASANVGIANGACRELTSRLFIAVP
jgi:hypothetical protein